MVSNLSLAGIIFSLLVALLLPVVLIIYGRKRYSISFSTIAVGALIFFVFVLVLEQLLHLVVLKVNPSTKALMENPWMFAIYGGLAAGIFEECGRFIAFKLFLKKHHQWKDGLAYGIGHGGIEAVILGGFAAINNLIYSLLINKGTFDSLISSKLQASTAEQLKNSMISTHWTLFFLSGLERCFALAIQIGLSILVIYAIKNKKYIYLLLAIFIHGLIDFPAALAQKGLLNIWVVEAVAFAAAIISIYWIINSKKVFDRDTV